MRRAAAASPAFHALRGAESDNRYGSYTLDGPVDANMQRVRQFYVLLQSGISLRLSASIQMNANLKKRSDNKVA